MNSFVVDSPLHGDNSIKVVFVEKDWTTHEIIPTNTFIHLFEHMIQLQWLVINYSRHCMGREKSTMLTTTYNRLIIKSSKCLCIAQAVKRGFATLWNSWEWHIHAFNVYLCPITREKKSQEIVFYPQVLREAEGYGMRMLLTIELGALEMIVLYTNSMSQRVRVSMLDTIRTRVLHL